MPNIHIQIDGPAFHTKQFLAAVPLFIKLDFYVKTSNDEHFLTKTRTGSKKESPTSGGGGGRGRGLFLNTGNSVLVTYVCA